MKVLSRAIKSFVATAILLSASAASATDYFIANPLESYPNPGFVSNAVSFGAPSSFLDKWSFSIGSGGAFISAVGVASAAPFADIENVLTDLYKVGDATPLFSGQLNIINAPLFAAGNYFVLVSGDVTGELGGSYHFYAHLTATPVPEPSELAMMMAGLSLIGFRIAKKRKV